MEEDIVPVYGQGFFHISRGTIYYTIIYDYLERSPRYRKRVLLNPEKRREEEISIANTMQKYMDEERILINGYDSRCIVDDVRLELRGPKRHSATIHARIPYQPVEGRNVYEDFYMPEVAPYDYTVYWIAPPGGRIVDVDSPGIVEERAGGRIAVIHVAKGTKLKGYEAVVFTLQ